jgi:hypothetical protein
VSYIDVQTQGEWMPASTAQRKVIEQKTKKLAAESSRMFALAYVRHRIGLLLVAFVT